MHTYGNFAYWQLLIEYKTIYGRVRVLKRKWPLLTYGLRTWIENCEILNIGVDVSIGNYDLKYHGGFPTGMVDIWMVLW